VAEQSNAPQVRTFSGLWIGIFVAGCLIVLAGLLYGIGYLLVGDGVLPHTTVAGVSVGGLSPAAAQAKITSGLASRADAPIAVKAGGQSFTVDPVAAGLTIDTRATLAAGGHRNATPAALWKALFAHPVLSPAVSVDTAKLDAAVTAINAKLVGGGHDGGIVFHGSTPVAVAPVQGIQIVHDKALAVLRAAYLTSSSSVVLPVQSVQPSVTDAAVQLALTTIAQPAVASPITLIVGPSTLQVPPSVIAQNLSFSASGGALVPTVDGDGIAASLGSSVFSSLETAAKDASFDVKSGKPVLVPAVEGGTADLSKLGSQVLAVLSQPAPRTVTVPSTGIDPTFSTADAQKLGVNEMVSTFTTHYPCCASRVTNIHAIANIVNGAIIMPGATFSLNQFVGPRDTKRGFVEAPMIEDGLFEDSIGGGVSQFATTMYNAVFFAGLKDIEHHPHSYYISRYPVGREATVSYPNPNLIFQNDEPTAIVVTTAYTGTSLTVTFWGTKYYDVTSTASARYAPTTTGTVYNPRPDCEASVGEGGFQIDVTQTLSQNGVVVQTNHLHTRYSPEPIIICGPSPSPTPGGSGLPGSPTPGAPTPGAPTVTPSPKPSTSPSH
jgi:vancomycin resistance protein YoaR